MDPEPVVFDISSDEEESGYGEPKGDDFDWLAEFLAFSADKQSEDDSDEVVVLGEVKPKPKSKSSKPTVRDVDDDCVILDGDPDNAIVDDEVNGPDDLLIVGEKGQIACRDFPHSRHLCATFPFRTTPHEKYCDLCHCYVCDSLAPCLHWVTNHSSIDHCHATDKEETWRIQRRNFKSGKSSPLLASKCSGSTMSIGLPPHDQAAPLNIIQLSPSSRPQNHVSRPIIQGCSSTNFSVPTIISRGRSQQSGLVLPKNTSQPRLVLGGQLLGASHNNRKSSSHLIGNSGHRHSSHTMFKRSGTVGVSMPMNQSAFGSSNSRNRVIAAQYARTPTPATALNDLNTIRWDDFNAINHQSSFDTKLVAAAISTPPSQSHVYSQPLPPLKDSQNFYQHGNQFQSNGQTTYRHGNATQNSSQNICSEDIGSASVKEVSSVDFNSSWLTNSSQSNQQPPVEVTQFQSTESFYEPSVKEPNSLFSIKNANLSSEYGFDDWFVENPSDSVVSDGFMPPQLNIFSPEPDPVDANMLLFDFETSWNGLTRA